MAGPGGKEVGRLHIRVVADTSRMTSEIKQAGERAERSMDPIKVHADTDQFVAEVDAARDEAGRGTVTIEVDAELDTRSLRQRVESAAKRASVGQKVVIGTELSQARFRQDVMKLRSEVINTHPTLYVNADLRDTTVRHLQERIRQIQQDIDERTREYFDRGAGDAFPNLSRVASRNLDAMQRELDRHKLLLRMEIDSSHLDANLQESMRQTDAFWDDYDRRVHRARIDALEIEESHARLMDKLERRATRVEIAAETVRRKFALAFGTVAIGGLMAGTQLLVGYLGAGAFQAVALAGGLTQAVGAAAVLPGLLSGTVAAISVLAIGFQDFGGAMKEMFSEDATPESIEKQLSKLTPAARRAAEALGALRPAFSELKRGIQESLFAGLDKGIEKLSAFAVAMRPSLMSIATGWSSIFSGIFTGLSDSTSIQGFDNTFRNFGSMMTAMSSGLPNWIRGWASLSSAGSLFFDRIGNYGAGVLRDFEGWVNRVTSDGSFERWVNGGVSAFSDFWAVIRNVSSSLSTIFRFSGGSTLLFDIRSMSFAMRDWVESAKGSETVTALFNAARSTIKDVHASLKPLGPVLKEVVFGVADFASSFSGPFAAAMKDGGDSARQFMQALTGLAAPLAQSLGAALNGIGKVAEDLGPSLASLAQQVTPLISELAQFASGGGGVFLATLTAILTVVNNLLQAVPGLAAGLGAIFAVNKMASFATETAQKLGLLRNATLAVGEGAAATAGKVGLLSRAFGSLPLVGTIVAIGAGVWAALDAAIETTGEKIDKLSGKIKSNAQAYVDAGKVSTRAQNEARDRLKESIQEQEALLEQEYQARLRYQEKAKKEDPNSNAALTTPERMRVLGSNMAVIDSLAKAQLASLPQVEQKAIAVTKAQNDLVYANEKYGASSDQAAAAGRNLQQASWELELAKTQEAAAQKTATEAINEQISAQRSLLALQGDAAQAQLNVNDAVGRYNDAIAKYGEGSLEAKSAMGQLSSAIQVATQNIGAAAQAQAVANGVGDGAVESYQAQMAYLQPLIDAGGPAAAAALAHADALRQTTAQAILSKDGFALLKDSIVAVPDAKTVIISDNSPATIQRLRELGYEVRQLPDGNIEVKAATQGALNDAYSLVTQIGKMSATVTVYTKSVGGIQPGIGGSDFADGGRIVRGSGPRADDVPINVSRDEYVINARSARLIGYETLDELNSLNTIRDKSKVGDLTGRFADGGSVNRWFDRAVARATASGKTTFDLADIVVPRSQPAGGNTFILPKVDPRSLAREIDRLNGARPENVGVL